MKVRFLNRLLAQHTRTSNYKLNRPCLRCNMSKLTVFPIVYVTMFFIPLISYSLCTPTPPSQESERIYNGTEIDPPHKYPFLAAIYWDGCSPDGDCSPGATGVACGASVVNKHWVVTAAHCCRGEADDRHRFIITGLHNSSAPSAWSQNLSISHCVQHFLYTKSDVTHDIGLIRVKGAIIFNDKVTPMNLPSLGFDVAQDVKAQAMGWGKAGRNNYPTVPNEVTLPLVTLDTCQRRYGYYESHIKPNPFNTSHSVLETNLCAGDGVPPKSSCSGDSGSPLVIYNSDKDTYAQVGVTSWGEMCGVRGHYSVYANVAQYIVWIKSVIRSCPERIINNTQV